MSPRAEHVLDWFHLSMRITVLRQHAKGLAGCHHDRDEAEKFDRSLRRIKGFLWHGNLHAAFPCIHDLALDLEGIETGYPNIDAFRKGVCEFQTCIANNAVARIRLRDPRCFRSDPSCGARSAPPSPGQAAAPAQE